MADFYTSSVPTDIELPDGFSDFCSLTVPAGDWLLIGHAALHADAVFTLLYYQMMLYDHSTNTPHVCMTKHFEGRNWSTFYAAKILSMPSGGTISMRAYLQAHNGPVVYTGVVDPLNDSTLLGSNRSPNWSHMAAIRVNSTFYNTFQAADQEYTVPNEFYDLLQTPALTQGRWFILGLPGTIDTQDSDHIYHAFWNGTDTRCYCEDGHAGGGNRSVGFYVQDIVPVEDGDIWRTISYANSVPLGHGRPVARKNALDFGQFSGSPPEAAIMIAIQVDDDGEGTTWFTQALEEDLEIRAGVWGGGPSITLPAGDWLVIGTMHMLLNKPPFGMTTAGRLVVDGLGKSASARSTDADPAFEGVVHNVFDVVTSTGTTTVSLQGYADAPDQAGKPGTVVPTKIWVMQICPDEGWTLRPGPDIIYPGSPPEQFPQPMVATRLTAIKIPISRVAAHPCLAYYDENGVLIWERTTELPG